MQLGWYWLFFEILTVYSLPFTVEMQDDFALGDEMEKRAISVTFLKRILDRGVIGLGLM